MSYEGYEQLLCASGHYWTEDVHYHGELTCNACKQPPVWRNDVDETNGEGAGYINMADLLVSEATFDECSHCGHRSELQPARYRIPSEEETHRLRLIFHQESGTWQPEGA